MTLSELHTPTSADTTGPDEFRRNSSAGVANPHYTMTSTRSPNNNASVTTVLTYPSKSNAQFITTWKLTDIEAFERIFQYPNDEAWRALRNLFPVRTMDTLHGIISMTRSERQLSRVSLEDLDITDVIQTLKGVAAGTDINAIYNPRYF